MPVVLTWNEAANLRRTLEALRWARRVLVLDSGSTDATAQIAGSFANVVWRERAFDDHARQSNFALDELVGETPWVMFLDADYVLTPELIEELRQVQPDDRVSGYRVRFRYCVDGVPLNGTLYPPRVVLFRRERGRFVQEGHAHLLQIYGSIVDLRHGVLHDDRKAHADFVNTQRKYAKLEAAYLHRTPWSQLRWSDRIRRLLVVAPWVAPLYALLIRGVALNGAAGWKYAGQRALAETFVARELLRAYLSPKTH